MIVTEITDIHCEDNYVYYRQTYTATAVYSLLGNRKNGKIEFSIETKPTGEKDISVKMLDKIDYPLLKLLTDLKAAIRVLIDNKTV